MYKNSEILRTSLSTLFGDVLTALSDAFGTIKTAIESVLPAGTSFSEVFKSIGDFIGKYIVPVLGGVLVVTINLLAGVIAGLIKTLKGFYEILTINPIAGIKTIFSAIIGVFKSFIESIAKVFGYKVSWAWLTDGLTGTVEFIAKAINKISEFINKAINGFNKINPFKNVPTIPPIAIPVKLAKGGVIPSTTGGVLATIGEAGRAERVEPLDPDGLSKRDKAMIQLLSGGAGSGVTVNVYPSPGMDERELASIVSRQLALQFRTGAA